MMQREILTLIVKNEQDLVTAGAAARRLAVAAGLIGLAPAGLAAATTEAACLALVPGATATVRISAVDGPERVLIVAVRGPGIVATEEDQTREALASLVDRLERDPDAATDGLLLIRKVPRLPVDVPSGDSAGVELTFEALRTSGNLAEALRLLDEHRRAVALLSNALDESHLGVQSLYAELDEKVAALAGATAEKDRVVAYVNHELRTPVDRVVSLARTLVARGSLGSADTCRQLGFVQQAAEELRERVDELVEGERDEEAQAEGTGANIGECDMAALFAALRGVFRPLLPDSGQVDLLFDLPSEAPRLHTDGARLAQILRVLVANALKHTDNGQVLVKVEEVRPSWVRILVADTGAGFAPERLARLFEGDPDLASRPEERHVKFGLPWVGRLSRLIGGKLEVESEVGVGTVFWMDLPVDLRTQIA